MLTIVPTPIGNLKDITLRALEVLKSVDGIICEDSRRTSQLLNHYQIKKPLLVVNDFNEFREIPRLVQKLQTGESLALVSDAGTPLISDPGYKLVRICLESGIEVDSLPGPSSILPALTLSGLPPDKFLYLGYPPEKPGHRIELLQKIKKLEENFKLTIIFFVSPYKLLTTLKNLKEVFGEREITLAKELTKIYQKVQTKTLSEWEEELKKSPPKGEYILLFNLAEPK